MNCSVCLLLTAFAPKVCMHLYSLGVSALIVNCKGCVIGCFCWLNKSNNVLLFILWFLSLFDCLPFFKKEKKLYFDKAVASLIIILHKPYHLHPFMTFLHTCMIYYDST